MVAEKTPHLTAKERGDLADVRLVLDSAAAGVKALAVHQVLDDDARQLLDNAELALEQALATVRRLKARIA